MQDASLLRKSSVVFLAVIAACCLIFSISIYAIDVEAAVAGLQRRYASVNSVAANFQQIYRAPGVNQVESGVFWMKKPGLMRWEYQEPEKKLFIADGRKAYLYVPQDRQVTEQSFSASDMHDTPLEFLLGAGNINKSFDAQWETELKPDIKGTLLIRLTPRTNETGYLFLVLEIDRETFDLRRIAIHETGGNTSEYLLTNLRTNVKVDNKEFQFKNPKGVEVIKMTNGE